MAVTLPPAVPLVQQAPTTAVQGGTETMRVDIKGRPMIRVSIDGRAPFDVIVDTGATSSVIQRDAAEALGLPKTGADLQVSGVAGGETASLFQVRTLSSRLFSAQGVSLPGLSGIGTTQAKAIIGMDMFADRKLVFDRGLQEVRVTPSGPAEAGAITLRGKMSHDGLIIPLTINGVEIEGLVDSGADGSVVGSSVLRALGWKSGDPRLTAFGQISGAGAGSGSASIATMDSIALGPAIFKGVRVVFADGMALAPGETGKPRMIVGLDILNRLQTYALDFPRVELQFRQFPWAVH